MATKYIKMIDDFDDLIDPRTLAHHFLGPEPSSFILLTIEIEEKSDFFFFWHRNDDQVQSGDVCEDEGQEEWALSSLGKKVVRVVKKGVLISPAISPSLKP